MDFVFVYVETGFGERERSMRGRDEMRRDIEGLIVMIDGGQSIIRGWVIGRLFSLVGFDGFRLSRNTTSGGEAFLSPQRHPGFVLLHGKPLIDLVHGHKLLFASPSSRALHGGHVDRFALWSLICASMALIVSKTILYPHDDPVVSAERGRHKQYVP